MGASTSFRAEYDDAEESPPSRHTSKPQRWHQPVEILRLFPGTVWLVVEQNANVTPFNVHVACERPRGQWASSSSGSD